MRYWGAENAALEIDDHFNQSQHDGFLPGPIFLQVPIFDPSFFSPVVSIAPEYSRFMN